MKIKQITELKIYGGLQIKKIYQRRKLEQKYVLNVAFK